MERYIQNGDVKIHVFDQNSESPIRILMVPGMFGVAEHWLQDFNHLKKYSLSAMSVRGRGKSSHLSHGYSFQDQVSDVIAVIDAAADKNIVLLSHSYGCLLATAAACERSDRVKGLILIDKGLVSDKISKEWLDFVKANPPTTSSFEVAQNIYNQSAPVNLIPQFTQLNRPTLIFKGETKGSHLQESEAQKLEKINITKVVRLKHSGHAPEGSDYEIFISEIHKFVDSL